MFYCSLRLNYSSGLVTMCLTCLGFGSIPISSLFQIYFIVFGDCGDGLDQYREIAMATGGQVFYMEKGLSMDVTSTYNSLVDGLFTTACFDFVLRS